MDMDAHTSNLTTEQMTQFTSYGTLWPHRGKKYNLDLVWGLQVKIVLLPEHAVAQSRPQSSGSKVTDVSPVKTLLGERDADHDLDIVDV